MRIFSEAPDRRERRVLVLGTFDGVHRGHQVLLAAGKLLAEDTGSRLMVCTFEPHPLAVLRPKEAPGLLTTWVEKTEKMAALGVDEIRKMAFTQAMADMAPENFLELLRQESLVIGIVAGWNYSFGKSGAGTADTLISDGKVHDYRVVIVPPVRTAEEIISSSAIRRKLMVGDLIGAKEMLGEEYTLRGPVEGGKHLGTKLGAATANIHTEEQKQLPAYGVYACRMAWEDEWRKAVVNIGFQPTLPSGRVTVEAHALEEVPNLYGREVRLRLVQYLRPEVRFDSPEALMSQIRRDGKEAETILGKACQEQY